MNHDQTFRVVITVGLLILLPIGLYYRLKSQATRERLDRRQEGLFILLTLRPVGLIVMLGLVAYLVRPSWMAWSSVSLPDWLRWIGIALGAAACGLVIWTFHSLGKNLTDTVVTRREHTMVTTGPYRWVRHPLYDAGALFTVAISLAAANWFLLLMGSLALILLIIRTRKEEQNLLTRFGDAYRGYMERTGRFLPRMEVADRTPE